jgi:hypothetical protein
MPSTSIFQSSIFGAPTRLKPTTHRVVRQYWSSAPHANLRMVSSNVVSLVKSGHFYPFSMPANTGKFLPVSLFRVPNTGIPVLVYTGLETLSIVRTLNDHLKSEPEPPQTILKCQLPSSFDYRTRQ